MAFALEPGTTLRTANAAPRQANFVPCKVTPWFSAPARRGYQATPSRETEAAAYSEARLALAAVSTMLGIVAKSRPAPSFAPVVNAYAMNCLTSAFWLPS